MSVSTWTVLVVIEGRHHGIATESCRRPDSRPDRHARCTSEQTDQRAGSKWQSDTIVLRSEPSVFME
jgi:hypothetical protein